MKFGEKVRAARQNAGMSQEALAKAVDVSLRTILGYENENRYPRKREIYAKLADALHVDVNYLLTEDEEFAAAIEWYQKFLTANPNHGNRMCCDALSRTGLGHEEKEILVGLTRSLATRVN